MPRVVVVLWDSGLGYRGSSVRKQRPLGQVGQRDTESSWLSVFSGSENLVEFGLDLQKGCLLS